MTDKPTTEKCLAWLLRHKAKPGACEPELAEVVDRVTEYDKLQAEVERLRAGQGSTVYDPKVPR